MRLSHCLFIILLLNLGQLADKSFAAEILVVESYHAEYQWDIGYKKALTEYLANDHQLSYFEMDTKRVAKEKYLHRAELAWDNYKKIQPDLVILGDDNALKYLGPLLAKTDTPVVYLGINNNPRNYQISQARNITGVLERPLIKRSVMSIGTMLPKTKRLLILFDSGNTAHTLIENIFNNESITTISDIQVEIKLIQEWEIWQSQVEAASANQFDAIVIGLFHTLRDKNELHIPADKALSWTSQNSPLPVFALWDFAVGKNKAIGGLVLQAYHQGVAAAQLAQKILSGIPPHRLRPITATNGSYLFSQAELDKYQIRLPDYIMDSAILVE